MSLKSGGFAAVGLWSIVGGFLLLVIVITISGTAPKHNNLDSVGLIMLSSFIVLGLGLIILGGFCFVAAAILQDRELKFKITSVVPADAETTDA